MNGYQVTRTTAIGLRRHPLTVSLMLVILWSATDVLGQQMRFVPIRSAPLGSPVGTIGEPVTPEFNNTLGCWELTLQDGGVEVELDLQAFGWSHAPGNPVLGAIQGTVVSAGYSNGLGGDLSPKGWIESSPGTQTSAYLSVYACSANGHPCRWDFLDPTCGGGANGTCDLNPDFVEPPCVMGNGGVATPTLDFTWAAMATVQPLCNENFGAIKTLGGLILDVPHDASGTYIIALNPHPDFSAMYTGQGVHIPGLVLTSACITIFGTTEPGRCCSDIGPNVVCEVVTAQVCLSRPEPRLFTAGETCGGDSACPICLFDSDCDDGDACTADACDEVGQCVHTLSCPEMRFYPIRSAPLGSPAETIGDPVTPRFNSLLGCWEFVLPSGGLEVDLDLQVFGWGNAPGSPTMISAEATVVSAGYSNGVGSDLIPKGWPGNPGHGAYQAVKRCESGGDSSPCVSPFDLTCDGGNNGACVLASNFAIDPCGNQGIPAIATPTLDYVWATASVGILDCNVDDGKVKTLGGLILNVPPDAAGTYLIEIDPDPVRTLIRTGAGTVLPDILLTPACLTIVEFDKNRYLTFDPDEPGPVAYKLDMISSLFHPSAIVSGWVGVPDANGIASLESDPVTREWTEAAVHITGCEITPVAQFELAASPDDGLTFLTPTLLHTTPQPAGSKFWGDIVGFFDGNIWRPAQGVVNADDILSVIKTWQQAHGAPALPRTDVTPQEPNRVVNINDMLFVIFAFRGEFYPFGCPNDPCQDNLANPCP